MSKFLTDTWNEATDEMSAFFEGMDARIAKAKTDYRVQNSDGTFLNAGTDSPSWFNLDEARKFVDYEAGQRIVEHDGMNVLWEVL